MAYEKDHEKAIRDDSSSEEQTGKPVTNAFTSVDDSRDAHSYEDLPRSLLIKTDLRLIPTLALCMGCRSSTAPICRPPV